MSKYSDKTQKLFQNILDQSNLPKRDKFRLLRKINGENLNDKATSKPRVKLPKPKMEQRSYIDEVGFKSFSGLRSKQMIEASGAYQKQYYAPITNKKNSEEDKLKLQRMMTYGKDESSPVLEKRKPCTLESVSNQDDEFEMIMSEINERKEFLEKVKTSERYKEYEAKINCEIAQRLKELEKIDKNRREEIEKIKNELKFNQSKT